MEYKELTVWQKAMDLALLTYKLVKSLPREELYGLSDQMRRSAVSIPSNIAEGYQRGSDKELSYFLRIALGSCAELETQLLLCKNLEYCQTNDLQATMRANEEVGKMLNAFLKKLTVDDQ